jgi:hypothetical protein
MSALIHLRRTFGRPIEKRPAPCCFVGDAQSSADLQIGDANKNGAFRLKSELHLLPDLFHDIDR